MKGNDSIATFNPQAPKVLSDYPEIPRRSKREEFVTDLILVGAALMMIALAWAIDHFTNISS